jgi:hypothetical protein
MESDQVRSHVEGVLNGQNNVLSRLLCNVTDRHLKPLAPDAMKVSLAAQVLSSATELQL